MVIKFSDTDRKIETGDIYMKEDHGERFIAIIVIE